jgi:hypothetical protein
MWRVIGDYKKLARGILHVTIMYIYKCKCTIKPTIGGEGVWSRTQIHLKVSCRYSCCLISWSLPAHIWCTLSIGGQRQVAMQYQYYSTQLQVRKKLLNKYLISFPRFSLSLPCTYPLDSKQTESAKVLQINLQKKVLPIGLCMLRRASWWSWRAANTGWWRSPSRRR